MLLRSMQASCAELLLPGTAGFGQKKKFGPDSAQPLSSNQREFLRGAGTHVPARRTSALHPRVK